MAGWLDRWYRACYRLGVTPWEQDTEELAPQIQRLLARVEEGCRPPYGRALDLGCGTGRWSVELAARGWQVTGVDVVSRAVRAAERRARDHGVEVTFLTADATRLREIGVQPGFDLVLDVECLHHLGPDQRSAMAREVDAVTTAEASILLLGWSRGRRGPLPPGIEPDELRATFPGWQPLHQEPYAGDLPAPLRRVAPSWHLLRRP